ncbi:hypothetical protein EYF80_018046 [Liparis tanakae]|uniref:Uncharacterized protein n=1 Tax=Liparis tanakae TaxID=230148 RepID=A0A4Z2I2K3_9TELE|nr:hypothetical protein EYF80_018046 [Liparis tanakae]
MYLAVPSMVWQYSAANLDHLEFIDQSGLDMQREKGNLSHLRNARQIHQCEVHDVWGEDFQDSDQSAM